MKKQAPPSYAGKTSFLLEEVEAYNVAKSEHSWKQGIGCKTTEELVTLDVVKDKKQTRAKMIGKKKTKQTKQKPLKHGQKSLTNRKNNRSKTKTNRTNRLLNNHGLTL